MKKIAKNKIFTGFIAMTTIVWAMGLAGVLTPLLPAQAAVTVATENRIYSSWDMSGGMMSDVAAFKVTADSGETLNSINVRFNSTYGTATPAAMLSAFNVAGQEGATDVQGLSIYKDSNANGWFDPGGGDIVVPWEVQPTWTDNGNGTFDTSLNIVDDTLPTSYAGDWNYFLHMQMAASPDAGKSFKFQFGAGAGGAIVTSGTSPSITAFETNSINSSGGGGGDYTVSPRITDIFFKSPTSLVLDFDMDMDTTSVNCNEVLIPGSCSSKYTLFTRDGADNQTIITAVRGVVGDNTMVTLTAHANARIGLSSQDYLVVSTDPAQAPRDATNGMSYNEDGVINFHINNGSAVISEIKIGGSATTDEFIELYITDSGGSVDLDGYKVTALVSNVYVTLATLGPTSLDTGKHYLLANKANDYNMAVDGVAMLADFNFSGVDLADNDTIILVDNNGVVIDLVGFGAAATIYQGYSPADSPAPNGSIERKAVYSSTGQSMSEADVDGGNGYNSLDNGYDFVSRNVLDSDPQPSTATAESSGMLEDDYVNSTPTIEHMPIAMAIAGQSITIDAYIYDVENSFNALITKQLCYKAPNGSWPGTCVTGTDEGQNRVEFYIPASEVTISGLNYYIEVIDSGTFAAYASSNPTSTTAVMAKLSPFLINISAIAGSRMISGTVYQSDCITPIYNANVYVKGTGLSSISSASGVFTITGVSDGTYNLEATASGYLSSEIWGASVGVNNPNSSGWVFCLSSGTAGQGGDSEAPQVIMSMPGDGMMGAPIDIVIDRAPMFFMLDKEIDMTTVSCTDCDAATDNIKLKKVSGGSITNITDYNVSFDTGLGAASRGQTVQFGGSTSNPVIVIDKVALLEIGTDYIIEITPGVKDMAGNPLEGNRPGGGHTISFTTQSTSNNFSGSSGFDFTEDETFWQTGDFSSMTEDAGYATMMGNFDADKGMWAGGAYSPLYVYGSQPSPGSWNVPTNLTKIVIEFSEPIDTNSVNKGAFNLYSVSGGVYTDVTSTSIVDAILSSNKLYVIMDINGTLPVGEYEIRVKGGVRSMSGITLGDPNNPGNDHYMSNFTVTNTTDVTAPTMNGSWPENNDMSVPMDFGFIDIGFAEALDPTNINTTNVTLKTGTSTVPTNVEYDAMRQSIKIIPTTGLTPGVAYTATISFGASAIQDLAGLPMDLSGLLLTFKMTTTADSTQPVLEFANCDSYSCAITFNKGMSALKQSEASSNANLWTGSVRNPANYALTFGPGGTDTVESLTASGVSFNYEYDTNTVLVEGLSFTGLNADTDKFVLTVTNVLDLSNNPINTSANTAGGYIMDSSKSGGMMGPGGGGFMGGGMMGGGIMTGGPSGFGGFGAKEAMMMGAGVMPMNMTAGATTTYFIDFPMPPSGGTANKLDDGSYFKLTFPKGTTLTGAIPDPYNPSKTDLNMNGDAVVVLSESGIAADSVAATQAGAINDGVTVSGQTMTLWLDTNSGTTSDPDMFHFEVKGIVNPKAQDFNSSGYTVDMKAYNSGGTLIESMTSMPYFINAAGSNNITINVTAEDGLGDMTLMMGSPMSGPMDADVSLMAGVGTQTWSNLNDGCYHIFTEPTITLGIYKYSGQMNPEPICLPGSGANWTEATSTLTKALTFTKRSAANSAQLAVLVSGTFADAGEDVDIFAFGPNGGTVETVTFGGEVVNNSTTLFLPSNGDYNIGIGPAMPKGPMAGPPPMPDWMPPMTTAITVSGVGGTPVVKRNDTNATITELPISITSATKEIRGLVVSKGTTIGASYTAAATSLTLTSGSGFAENDFIYISDGTNTATDKILSISGTTVQLTSGMGTSFASGSAVYNIIPDTELWANQPMGFGGMGSHATSQADGSFVLKVASNGTYDIGAWKSGIGDAPSSSATVKDNNGGTVDGNSTADVKVNGANITTVNPFLIKIGRPDYVISGRAIDSSNNPMQYTHVMAEETTTRQMAHSNTDSDGDYILNVSAGTWSIQVDTPPSFDGCGSTSATVVVAEATGDMNNQTLQPATTTCYTISGNVSVGGNLQTNVPIMVEAWDTDNDWPSGGYNRHEMTDTAGNYAVKAGAGTYRVSMWSPDYGEVGSNVVITSANVTQNISYDASELKTLTIAFTGGTASQRGFVEAKSTTGSGRRGIPVADLSSSTTMSLPVDTYKVMVFVDGLGDYSPSSEVDLTTTDQTVTINLSTETSHAVSGTILDSSDNPVSGAAVLLVNETTGLAKQATTDANGDYSATVKEGTFTIKAEHKDYASLPKATLAVTSDINYDFDSDSENEDIAVDNDLVEKTVSISGTIYKSDGTTEMNTGGFVYATDSVTGSKAKANIQDDGTYILPVTAGNWTVIADGPLHSETTLSTAVSVSSTNVASEDITLTEDATDIKKSESSTFTPSSGVNVNDENNTGFEITASSGSLGQNSTATSGTITLEEVDMPASDNLVPVGNFVDVSMRTTTSSGTSDINQLTGNGAEIVFHYTAADMTAAGITDESMISLAYYDDTTETLMPLDNLARDTTNNTVTGTITHLTEVGLVAPPLVSSSAPRSVMPSAGSAVITTPATDEVTDVVEDDTSVVTDTDIDTVTTVVTDVKEVTKTVIAETTAVTSFVPEKPADRSLAKESLAVGDYIKLTRTAPDSAEEWKVIDYMAYGTTAKVKSMTNGERFGLLEDYKIVYNRLPAADTDWESLGKMAQGTTPARIIGREAEALKAFVKVFGRVVDFSKSAEEKFIHSVAYYLRPAERDMAKEQAALGTFADAYNKLPNTSFFWSVLRGVAYSGVEKNAPVPVPEIPAVEVTAPALDNASNVVPAHPATADRNLKAEITAVSDYSALMGGTPDSAGWSTIYFISYGSTDASMAMTSAERLEIIKTYKSQNDKLPTTDSDWQAVADLVQ